MASGIGKGFSRSLMRAEGRDERNSEDRRAIITKIAGNCALPLFFYFFPFTTFFSHLELRLLQTNAATTNELGVDGFMPLYSLLKTITMEDALTNAFHFETC